MTATETSERLVRWALEAGFHRAGVARLEVAAGATAYRQWVERGDHAAMTYMENRQEVRSDPRNVFEGARSAICVALQYDATASDEATLTGDLWPRVARYARGRDYHNVMTKRLRKLARRIEAEFRGARTKPYVDTGPVLERELAAAAGLGVAGKNTMLLHPEAGSYFLLGELLTSLDLIPDAPLADLCGSCSLCLEACPTGALPEPFRLDSRRCISYWTIEHRGAIPEMMREGIGDWVFGCDICQEACPHNDKPVAVADPAFALAEDRGGLELAELLALDPTDYQELFRGSPMKRARLEGLRRNACVAMGNRCDPAYVPALRSVLVDVDPVVREHAAWALGRIGGDQAIEGLREAHSEERVEGVLEALQKALSRATESARNANSQLA